MLFRKDLFVVAIYTSFLLFVNAQDCFSETNALQSNSAVANAKTAVASELDKEITAETGCTGICTYDFDEVTAANYKAACQGAGGQYVEETILINCVISGNSIQLKYVDYPVCVAASCDSAETAAVIGDVGNSLDKTGEIFGATCTSDTSSAPAAAPPKSFLMIGSILLASVFLY